MAGEAREKLYSMGITPVKGILGIPSNDPKVPIVHVGYQLLHTAVVTVCSCCSSR